MKPVSTLLSLGTGGHGKGRPGVDGAFGEAVDGAGTRVALDCAGG